MKLTIVYDNVVYKRGIGLKSDWGFACLIESKYDKILFDTGANGKILLNNMKKLNIDYPSIKKIVISHNHQDHKGGLKSLTNILKDVDLYQLNYKINRNFMKTIIPEIPEEISRDIWTTGRIKGLVDEQSLVLKVKGGCYIITGCSHPGVENIFKVVNSISNIKGIIGGFHGFNNFSLMENLDYICPCHCTAHKKDFKKAFPNVTSDCGVGKVINFEVK
jgi:7,8-dihydropterin-6-yl-methyl-4-(beta-D-ribofuranosyl)aminobenzene 5'-phosphate synthase